MKVWRLGICAGVLVVAAVFCGCTTGGEGTSRSNEERPRRIIVQGVAEVEVPAEYLTVSIEVDTLDEKHPGPAQKENDRKVREVLAFLKELGIDDADVQTQYASLRRSYEYTKDQPRKFLGYEASQSITVRLRNFEAYGPLVVGIVDRGVDEFSSADFGFAGEAEKRQEVRMLAVKAARDKAAAIAAQLGMQAKPVLISEFKPSHVERWEEDYGYGGFSFEAEEAPEPDIYRPALAAGTVTVWSAVYGVFELVE